jgi:phosphotransferase system enzyme I (PtsI)
MPPGALVPREPIRMRGIAGSPGVAVGTAVVLGDAGAQVVRKHVSSANVAAEVQRVHEAVESAKNAVKEIESRLSGVGRETTTILEAYQLMLSDPLLLSVVERKVRFDRKCAEWAVVEAKEEIAAAFGPTEDEKDAYIAARRHDVEFVCDRLLRALVGAPHAVLTLSQPSIVVAKDLSPADTASMTKLPVLAFLTEVGTRTSHTSIMARALEIPCVVGVQDALSTIRTGDTVIVDGLSGQVVVHPTDESVHDARVRAAQHVAFAKRLLLARDKPCRTACGEPVSLKANVELPAEAVFAVDHGAEGVGLYRTEFLYIDRAVMPTEDEQYEIFRAVLLSVGVRPVTLRTFDLGGDKFASSFPLPAEMNPALGLRAVRLALKAPEVFMTQLRAMARASAHGDLRIMVPMVTTVHEMREAKRMLLRAIEETRAAGHEVRKHIPFGMMIEVPSAAVLADVFAKEAEFFSIGTNDLVQYSMAIDRTSRSLAELGSPFDPSILRLIHATTRAGTAAKIPVSICGAMASDPLAACLLIGLGLRELSMEAAAIPEIKEALSRISVREAENVAEAALACDSADAVRELLDREFAPRLIDIMSGVSDEPVTITRSSTPPSRI